ncbi:PTS transporter subunit EIIB [Alkalicoccobacillus plakortidis]|uniref:PTS transporter subunit EIIB n=1 Tax=Alkalicoccobacillus plakortidis TaxID=444060 RepID=A0ABT0XM09_9BACI|nr:PTS transporter subunit EIIB [Alkalicoccobacillus plakortidis]MCM2676242.1 PTS transporter subunit EIIB [Alkalicoccobacillus plakortidis]
MNEKENVKHIIEYVGGEHNIKKVWHCMTRLRFDLYDFSKINREEIKALEGVMGDQLTNDQYQIVIGTHVQKVHEALTNELNIEENSEESQSASTKKKGFFGALLDVVSGVFGPIVPAIAWSLDD